MITATQAISNNGWDLTYLLIGGVVGVFGAVLMMVWEEVREEREANEDARKRARGDGAGQDDGAGR